uniref:Uncharacterized protein n=1 Tax=Anguilla anguilla TaxID=7936 RepID=A0A0E9VQ47_ANGAN
MVLLSEPGASLQKGRLSHAPNQELSHNKWDNYTEDNRSH